MPSDISVEDGGDPFSTEGLYEVGDRVEPERITQDDSLSAKRKGTEEAPLPIFFLLEAAARRTLVDWILTDADEEKGYTKSEIAEESGVARPTVYDHFDVLIEFGLLTEDERTPRSVYRIDPDNPVFQALIDTNQIAAAYLGLGQ